MEDREEIKQRLEKEGFAVESYKDGDIPGWPSLTVTDDHKRQAADLLKSIKDANPQHEGVFKKIEDGAIHVRDGFVEGAAGEVVMPLLILAALASGRPLFGD